MEQESAEKRREEESMRKHAAKALRSKATQP